MSLLPLNLLLFAVLLGLACPSAAEKKIKLASDDWCPYICASERGIVGGLLVDVAEEIAAGAGIKTEPVLAPLNRAMVMVDHGALDGVFAPAIDNRLLLTQPVIQSRACFYTKKRSNWRYQGKDSLKGVKISVIDDYGYDAGEFDTYVADAKRVKSPNVSFQFGDMVANQHIKMLLADRFVAMVEHEAVMRYQLSLMGPDAETKVQNAGCLPTAMPLVFGFGKSNPLANDWIKVFNDGLAKLHASGRLKQLMGKYRIER